MLFQINVRNNRRGAIEWRIQRHRQHWTHKKQDEDKTENTTYVAKKMSNTDPTKTLGVNLGACEG